MRLILLILGLAIPFFVSSQVDNSFQIENDRITIEIIVEEPFCSLCLMQLNSAFSDKDFRDYTFTVRYFTSNIRETAIMELRIKEYLKDILFNFINESNFKSRDGAPYLIISGPLKKEIIPYGVIFSDFNERKLRKRIKQMIKELNQTSK
jgi:hypothetical protein